MSWIKVQHLVLTRTDGKGRISEVPAQVRNLLREKDPELNPSLIACEAQFSCGLQVLSLLFDDASPEDLLPRLGKALAKDGWCLIYEK